MQRLRLTPGSDDKAAGLLDAYLEAEPEAAEDRARAAAAWVQATSSVDPFSVLSSPPAFRRPYPKNAQGPRISTGERAGRVNVPDGDSVRHSFAAPLGALLRSEP